jgi:hypothetical protein
MSNSTGRPPQLIMFTNSVPQPFVVCLNEGAGGLDNATTGYDNSSSTITQIWMCLFNINAWNPSRAFDAGQVAIL